LPRRFKVPGIHALHAYEHVCAARGLRLLDKILYLVGKDIHLDHEIDFDPLFSTQTDQHVQDRFPVLVPGEIIVRKEIVINARLVVFPQCLPDHLRVAAPHLATVHVDNRAETTIEWTASPTVDRSKIREYKSP